MTAGSRPLLRAAVVLLACNSCSEPAAAPPPPAPLLLASISAGNYATCGIDLNGAAWCWGDDMNGQLGFPAESACASESQPCALYPGSVATNRIFSDVSSGGLHNCGLSTGLVYCWGDHQYDQMGDVAPITTCQPLGNPCAPVPGQVYLSQDALQVSAGGTHSCAVRVDHAVLCWGYGVSGRLGNGGTGSSAQPLVVLGGLSFASVSAGGAHTCGLTTTQGQAYCWGHNHLGQLGDNSIGDRTVPTAVATTYRFGAIQAGVATTCAIELQGDMYCWGAAGSIGITDSTQTCGGFACVMTPRLVPGGFKYLAVGVGERFACGVTTTGTRCWGHIPGSATPSIPVLFGTLGAGAGEPFLTIGVGFSSACGITQAHETWCWGSTYHGMRGNGIEFDTTSAPTRVVLRPDSTVP